MEWPNSKHELARLGIQRVKTFCELNKIAVPNIEIVPAAKWNIRSCAYYRHAWIKICLERCQTPCGETKTRNWSWPANTIDREPYGVLAHELGHHCDVTIGMQNELDVYRYSSQMSTYIRQETNDKPLTSYCDNDAEWFAEMFRLYVTNPLLLRDIRPKTFNSISRRWVHIVSIGWKEEIGENAPKRITAALLNKGAVLHPRHILRPTMQNIQEIALSLLEEELASRKLPSSYAGYGGYRCLSYNYADLGYKIYANHQDPHYTAKMQFTKNGALAEIHLWTHGLRTTEHLIATKFFEYIDPKFIDNLVDFIFTNLRRSPYDKAYAEIEYDN